MNLMTENAIPAASDTPADPVYLRMRGQELGPAPARGILTGGIALTFAVIFVLDVVLVLALYWNFGTSYLGFIGWFIVLAILLTPYAIWADKRTRGKFWADSVTASGADWDKYRVDRAYEPSMGSKILTWLELPLLGPRMIVGALQRQKLVDASEVEPFLRRCTMMVYQLADFGVATPTAHLAKPGDTPEVLDRVIAYLDKRDWIGHSSDNGRVWLSSRAKDDLGNWGLLGPE